MMPLMFGLNRNLCLLWLGQFISQAGDAVTGMASLWLMLELTGSRTLTGLIAFSSTLPILLFSLPAGVAVDRFDRRLLMLVSDGFRMLLVCLIPVLLAYSALTPLRLAIIVFLMATFSSVFNPARDTLVPMMASREEYLRVNSLMQTYGYLAWFFGLFAAGSILEIVSLKGLFLFDSATFLLSFLCIYFIRLEPRIPVPEAKTIVVEKPSLWSELRAGLHYITVKDRRLLWLLVVTALNNFFIMGPASVGMPILVRESLAGSGREFAWLESMYGVGTLAGVWLMYRWRNIGKKGRTLMVALIFDGLTYCPLFWVAGFGVSPFIAGLAIIFIHSLGIPFIQVVRTSLIHNIVPVQFHGRVFSMLNLAVMGMMSLSTVVSGVALEFMSARTLFLVIGIGAGLTGLMGLLNRDLRNAD